MHPFNPSSQPLEAIEDCILAVHGGAGTLSRELRFDEGKLDECRAALEAALQAGYRELRRGAGSVDAVLAAVCSLEDAPCFNAGKGAAFNSDGRHELDAAVMDGSTRRAGAVAGVTIVKNPIVAARLVMDRSRHMMLMGAAADEFARRNGASHSKSRRQRKSSLV
jgi:L-asparaginase / beta-aspartyl-peptidase